MSLEDGRGPGWYRGGKPANTPLAAVCKKLCSVHCQDRSVLLQATTSAQDALSKAIRCNIYLRQKYKFLSGKMSCTTILTEHCTSWKESPTLTKCFLCGSSRGNNHHFKHTQYLANYQTRLENLAWCHSVF